MEYTVGSIADLISGKNTPNKPKVEKITLAQSTQKPNESRVKHSTKLKTKKKKEKISLSNGDPNLIVINSELLSQSSGTENPAGEDTAPELFLPNTQTKTKKSKKRKLETSDELVKSKKVKRKSQLHVSDDTAPIESAKPDRPKKKKNKKRSEEENNTESQSESAEDKIAKDSRTLFVGNIPVTVKKRNLLRLFTKYGHVESVRLRCIAPAKPGIPKRVAFIKKLMHPKRLTMHSYVTFTLREDAVKALAANGMKYKDHHLRVQISNDKEKPDPHKAIFVGNLPFDIEDEELWSTFESCGPIVSVRIVRDASTNMGIGIAYVNFESSDSVELALQMDNVTIKKNVIRIHRYSQKKKHGQRHQKGAQTNRTGQHNKKVYKRPKNYPGGVNTSEENTTKVSTLTVKNSIFQGAKSNINKKKPKLNKGVIKKMKLSQKIAPR